MILHGLKLWAVPILSGGSLPERLRPHAWLSEILEQRFASNPNTGISEYTSGVNRPVIAPPRCEQGSLTKQSPDCISKKISRTIPSEYRLQHTTLAESGQGAPRGPPASARKGGMDGKPNSPGTRLSQR